MNNYIVDINPFGSFQYAGVNHIFELFLKYKEEDNNLNNILSKLNSSFTFKNMNNINHIKNLFIIDVAADIKENKNDIDYVDYKTNLLKEIINSNNIDEVLIILKNNSYCLWDAINLVFNSIYDNNILNINIQNENTIGPILNQEIQKQNFKTGMQCAILFNDNIITNKESFYGFDT